MGGLKFPHLEDIDLAGKTVLVRVDLNVPMQGGKVIDDTRIRRLKPSLSYLLKKKCRIVLLSHFGRPGGRFVPSLSLAALVDSLSQVAGKEVQFGVDCIGPAAYEAVKKLPQGGILLLENLRFHPEEEKGDPRFARELAGLGDAYVNDAFSCSHRAHASITGIPHYLPASAGRLMEEELEALGSVFAAAARPVTAIVGGSKISTKLALLENLIGKVDNLVIGGAMANTFLLAQGYAIGVSLAEPDLKRTARRILDKAKRKGCNLILPGDVIVGASPEEAAATAMVSVRKIPAARMALDIGNETIETIAASLKQSKTVVWNGPLGVFETRPFDVSTLMVAREIAALTCAKKLKSIAGGGDTIAALSIAGLTDSFSYISTAGGAFLEWLEGKTLPGIAALVGKSPQKTKHRRTA